MNDSELKDAIDGLIACDKGFWDSGIHDEVLKRKVITYLRSLNEEDSNVLIGRLARDMYLTDDKLQQGYGIESVKSLLDWLSDNGIDF